MNETCDLHAMPFFVIPADNHKHDSYARLPASLDLNEKKTHFYLF